MEHKDIKLRSKQTTIQTKLSYAENLVLEKYRFKFRLKDKREVLRKIIREFDKLMKEKEDN